MRALLARPDALGFFAGGALIVAGVALLSIPAALIVAGVCVLLPAVLP